MFKLKIKDLITIGIYSALYFITTAIGVLIGAIVFRSINMVYAPALSALLSGVVYFLLIKNTKKFGAISIVGVVIGTFFFFSGHFALSFIPSCLFALIADLVAKTKKYESKLVNLISYVIFSYGNFGPIMLMWIAKEAYIARLIEKGKDLTYINKVIIPFEIKTVTFLVFVVMVCAVIGGLFGQHLVNKHFKNENK